MATLNFTLTFINFWVSDLSSNLGCTLEIDDSTRVLLHEPFLRIQSFTVFSGVCSNRSILLCDGRNLPLSQYVWMGDCWSHCRVNIGISHSKTLRLEGVLLLPVARNSWIVCVCEYLSETLDGMGYFCPSFHFRRNLSSAQQCGAVATVLAWCLNMAY